MSKHRGATLTGLAATLFLTLAALGIHGISAQTPEPLGVEIKTSSGAEALYMPVALPTQKNRLYVTLPVENGGEVSAVRIVPVMRGARVRFEAHAVSGDLTKAQSCADRLLLPSKVIATRTVGKGETAILSGEGWSATVTAVERRPEPASARKQGEGDGQASFIKTSAQQDEPIFGTVGCGCVGCAGGMRCCPNKGDCMNCTCGLVCCTGS